MRGVEEGSHGVTVSGSGERRRVQEEGGCRHRKLKAL